MKANYKRGGLFLFPAVLAAIGLALIFSAPTTALISIGAFGFGAVATLFLMGDKSDNRKDNKS